MKKILKFCVLFLTGMLLLTCQENPDAEADENGQSLPTETVVSDRVVVFVPEEGTAIEDNILEYDSAANRIVFKLPSVAHSPFVRSASRANNTRAIVQNFNLNEFSNLQVGQYLCVPPNEFVPTGLVLEITDVQYGPGSVAVTGGKPLFSDVIPEAAIKHTFGLMEFFHDAAFEMKFPMGDGINFKVTPSVVTDDKGDTKLKLVVDAKIDLLDGVDIIPGTNEKAEWGSACSFELNPEFTTTIYHKRGAMLPDVFKIRCEGDIITKWDLKLNLKLEKVVETELILATFKLGTVLIPGTPIWISPYLELKIKFGAEGHATIEYCFLDYQYPFCVEAGYENGDVVKYVADTKATSTPHPFINTNVNASVYADFKMGLQCSICDFNKGPQLEVGGGLKPKIGLQIANDLSDPTNDKITVEATATAYLSAKFQLFKFYQYELSAEPKLEIAKWTLYGFEQTWEKPDVPTDGLVAYYPFKWNANDESGNENHGTVHGATLTVDRKGNPGNAYNFDGIDDYIEIAHFSNMESLNNEATVCAWINIREWYFSDRGWFPIICSHTSYGPLVSFEINNADIYLHWLNKSFSAQSNSNLINQWNFICVTISDNEGKLYMNGTLIGEGNCSWRSYSTGQSLLIGLSISGLVEYANGCIDDVRIYNRALTDNEVQSLYNE